MKFKPCQKTIDEVIKRITIRMYDYSNTPLKKRRNAFDELYELEKDLLKLGGDKSET